VDATGLVVLAVALVVSAVAAWWLRTRNGAVRTGTEEGATVPEAGTTSTAVLQELGARPQDADLTVVQFSTAFCGPCRATRARLQQLQTTRPGLAYLHVDAESHLDAVRALDVRRTPTLFYLDRDGALIGRRCSRDQLPSPRGHPADLAPHSRPVPRRQLPVSGLLRASLARPDVP
jgi:thiol-disulfide isomerase/thioredoxin